MADHVLLAAQPTLNVGQYASSDPYMVTGTSNSSFSCRAHGFSLPFPPYHSLMVANADPGPEPVEQESQISNLTNKIQSPLKSSTISLPTLNSRFKYGSRYFTSQQAALPPPGYPKRRRAAEGSQATPQFRYPTSSCHV
jgi:hypothetical protein